jgi:probable O-glycosylation ligase (exosortase A-associated)
MRDLVMVLGVAAMIPFIFGRPFIGVMLAIWTALLVPSAFVYGFARSIPFNLIVVVTTLLVWPLSRDKLRLPANRTTVLLVLLAISGTASAALGIGRPEVIWDEWEKFAKIIVFALITLALINTRVRFEGLAYAIILSLGFHGMIEGLKFIVSGGAHNMVGPAASIISDNNHLALALLCTLPLVFFVYQRTEHALLKFLLMSNAALLIVAIIGTFSRGGLIGLSAVAVWAFFNSARKARYLAVVIPVAIAILTFTPDRWVDRMNSIKSAEESGSFMGRVIAWKQSTLIAMDHPFFGGGFHAVQDLNTWKIYSLNFNKLAFIPTDPPDPELARAAHSIYFQLIGDLGLVGTLLYLTLALTAWKNSAFVIKKAKAMTDLVWAADLARALQYSLVAFFVAGAALSMAYFELIFIIFAALASLREIVDRRIRLNVSAPAR